MCDFYWPGLSGTAKSMVDSSPVNFQKIFRFRIWTGEIHCDGRPGSMLASATFIHTCARPIFPWPGRFAFGCARSIHPSFPSSELPEIDALVSCANFCFQFALPMFQFPLAIERGHNDLMSWVVSHVPMFCLMRPHSSPFASGVPQIQRRIIQFKIPILKADVCFVNSKLSSSQRDA